MLRRAVPVLALLCLVLTAPGCGPGDGGGGDEKPDAIPDLPDEDGDSIADIHEGRDQNTDTDGDGTPDYLDLDSDGDGIPDAEEAGDALTGTPPVDSDGDGTPDFRDLDSDDNGRPDDVDGTGDQDGDGIKDFADLDDDGDFLADKVEIGPDPKNPIDTDGDGTPDFRDTDSDNDTILDRDELQADPDMDGIPAYRDLDSDEDCRPDAVEAGDADPATPPIDSDGDSRPDFLDLDADNDGLADRIEDPNCNGIVDTGETSAISADTDGDGVSDLIEVTAGTNPNDPADNPQANGDFVFVVPYMGPPDPTDDRLNFSTDLKIVDIYVLIDRSGSMSDEITSVKSNLQTVLNNLTCPPLGTGTPGDCIPDLWSGGGSFIYSGYQPYTNHVDLQPNPSVVGPALPGHYPGSTGCCAEPHLAATWSTVTGQGQSGTGCGGSLASYPARASCVGSPAGAGGIGYPCFRPNALPVVLIATDEPPSTQYTCPGFATTISAANAIGAKLLGILGSSPPAQTRTDLEMLATGTGAVDVASNPLVFNGAGGGAATAIEDAIRTLANNVPLDVSSVAQDDPSDAIDAVAAFVDHLETLQLGTMDCADGLTDQDSNADGFKDLYIDILPGTPVCWKLVAKMNTTVMPTADPQLFQATVRVYGDGVTLLDERDVYFLVPPVIPGEPID